MPKTHNVYHRCLCFTFDERPCIYTLQNILVALCFLHKVDLYIAIMHPVFNGHFAISLGWLLYKGLTVLHFRSLTAKWGFCWWFLWSLPGCSSWWLLAALRFTLFIVRNWSRKLTAWEMILLRVQTQRADSGTRAVVKRERVVGLYSSAVPIGVLPRTLNALNMKLLYKNLQK